LKTTLILIHLFISCISFSQKDDKKDSICFFVRNNISINDEEPWKIVYSEYCTIQKFNFQIFNRWGSLLFDAKSIEDANKFNPFVNQKNSKINFETGTYYWILDYTLRDDNIVHKQQGFINILR
jgi:hypothetical protein